MTSFTVHGPFYVPLIDAMDRLGISIVRSGDTMIIVFKDREYMRQIGSELVNSEGNHDRVTLSGLDVRSSDVKACKTIADTLFPVSKPAEKLAPPPPRPPRLPRPVRPPKITPKEPPKLKTSNLSDTLITIKHSLLKNGAAKAVFPSAIEPFIKKGTLVYYKKKDSYKFKDIVICKIQGSIVGACKVIKPGLRGSYLVEHNGKEVYTKRVYGKISAKKYPKIKEKVAKK